VFHEVGTLEKLAKDGGHPGVLKLIDSFQIKGPNGKHTVLVMKTLGSSLGYPLFTDVGMPSDTCREARLPFARKIVLQLLEAIKFVHARGIIHGGK
jgi:serine/threonine protein kinase